MSDPKQLTVREAMQQYYIPACASIARRTVQKIGHELNQWEAHTDNPSIGELGMSHFVEFRKRMVEAGRSAGYIECIVSDITTVLKHCCYAGVLTGIPVVGKRLRRRPKLKSTPTVSDLAAAYRNVEIAEWPVTQRWNRTHGDGGRFVPSGRRISFPIVWWQGVLATIYFAGFRKSDALSLKWDEIQADRILRRMQKTGFEIAIPIHPVLREHFDRMPQKGPLVFGGANSPKQMRRELRRICEAAGVPVFTFQAVRRLSAQAWQRSRVGCGSFILGHAFRGADRYYLDPFQELQAAIPSLEVPEPMGKKDPGIVETLRTMDHDEALKLLQTAVSELAAKGAPA